MGRTTEQNQTVVEQIIQDKFLESGAKDIDRFFEIFSVGLMLKEYALADDEIENGLTGGGGDGGCDAAYLFIDSELVNLDDESSIQEIIKTLKTKRGKPNIEMHIIQSKNMFSFKEDVLVKWKTLAENLLQITDEDLFEKYKERYNEKTILLLGGFANIYKTLASKIPSLSIIFYYVSKGENPSSGVLAQKAELCEKIQELYPNADISVKFYGAKELFEKYNQPITRSFTLEFRNLIPINVNREYIGLVNLYEFYKFISNPEGSEMVKHIFDSNVRDYQGSVQVNKEIQNTLQKNEIKEFWWLNNGVTILASAITMPLNEVLSLEDPVIVNGLQTSREIFNFFVNSDRTSEERRVLVRIILPENDDIRDRIILATNNQTSIPKAQLRVNHPIHRRIEAFFKSKGLYYERRKTQYKNEGRNATEIVSVLFLIQCLASVLLARPDDARARPSKLLTNQKDYEKMFSEKMPLEVFYLIAALGKRVKKEMGEVDSLTRSTQTNILFYVLFLLVARKVKKVEIFSKDLEKLTIDDFSSDDLMATITEVNEKYISIGGNDKAAKGPELLNALLEEISKENRK